jgi:hypothetical protein
MLGQIREDKPAVFLLQRVILSRVSGQLVPHLKKLVTLLKNLTSGEDGLSIGKTEGAAD